MKPYHLPKRLQLLLTRRVAVILLACSMWLPATSAMADIYVIVNASNPLRSMSAQDVADLYLGRTRAYPNGITARIIDQNSERSAHELFFRLLVSMSSSEVNAYWARLTFTGRVKPPEIKPDDAAVLARVASAENAIGYLAQRPADPAVRVVLQLREQP